jgi:outer membrane protein assembly factor BamA
MAEEQLGTAEQRQRAMDVIQKPLRIRRVHLVGPARTKPHVIEDELQRAYRAGTVKDVVNELQLAAISLDSLGIFSKVDVVMDQAGQPDETDVTITVKEKG